uniref:Uncharacterized protein n=1 Tax=Solanum tuberosum TaxID=4113 RepID=M1CNW1_SOLTU
MALTPFICSLGLQTSPLRKNDTNGMNIAITMIFRPTCAHLDCFTGYIVTFH